MRNPVLAAVDYGGPFEVPPIGELFNLPALFSVGGVDITRVYIIVLFAVAAVMVLFTLAFSNAKVVPGRLQAAAEALVEFVREQVAIDVIGPDGRRYAPLLVSIFFFVWFNNLFEIIPFVNFPSTSRIAYPMFLAAIVWVTFLVVGIRTQGLVTYFKDILIPPGVPMLMVPLIGLIEFISTVIVRPITLTVRLFANMVAGHILLTIVFIAIHSFLVLGPGLPVGVIVLAIAPFAVGFELLVGVLQAYIFVILTAVYIDGSLHPAH